MNELFLQIIGLGLQSDEFLFNRVAMRHDVLGNLSCVNLRLIHSFKDFSVILVNVCLHL